MTTTPYTSRHNSQSQSPPIRRFASRPAENRFSPISQAVGLYISYDSRSLAVATIAETSRVFNDTMHALIYSWEFVGPRKNAYNMVMTALFSANLLPAMLTSANSSDIHVSGLDIANRDAIITAVTAACEAMVQPIGNQVVQKEHDAAAVFSRMYSLDQPGNSDIISIDADCFL